MSNIIWRDFRTTRRVKATVIFDVLHVYGESDGCRILLIKDSNEHEGETYKIAIDDSRYREVDVVSMLPLTENGRFISDLIGEAIVRTLYARGRYCSTSGPIQE